MSTNSLLRSILCLTLLPVRSWLSDFLNVNPRARKARLGWAVLKGMFPWPGQIKEWEAGILLSPFTGRWFFITWESSGPTPLSCWTFISLTVKTDLYFSFSLKLALAFCLNFAGSVVLAHSFVFPFWTLEIYTFLWIHCCLKRMLGEVTESHVFSL